MPSTSHSPIIFHYGDWKGEKQMTKIFAGCLFTRGRKKGGVWWGGIGFRCDDTAETGLNLHAHIILWRHVTLFLLFFVRTWTLQLQLNFVVG